MPSIKDIVYNRKQAADYMKKIGGTGSDDELVSQYIKENPDDAQALSLPNISKTKSAALGFGSGITGGIGSKALPSIFGTQEELALAEQVNPKSFAAGDIAGSLTQTAPLMMIPGVGELKAAQLLSKVPKLAKTTGLTAKTLPQLQKVAQASTISGGLRGVGTTPEGASAGEYAENILGGALKEGTLGTIFGVPSQSKTAQALKTGLVGYGLGSTFGDEEGTTASALGLAGLASPLARRVPMNMSAYFNKPLLGLGQAPAKAITSDTGKSMVAGFFGVNPVAFKEIANDEKQVVKILRDINKTPLEEKQKDLISRLEAIRSINLDNLQKAETAKASLVSEAKINKVNDYQNRANNIVSTIQNLFTDPKNPASTFNPASIASAKARSQAEQSLIKAGESAIQGDNLNVSNILKPLIGTISKYKIQSPTGKSIVPKTGEGRQVVNTLNKYVDDIKALQSKNIQNIPGTGMTSFEMKMAGIKPKPIDLPNKLSPEDYLTLKKNIEFDLQSFKPGEQRPKAVTKALLDVKQMIDEQLKANVPEFKAGMKEAEKLQKIASTSAKKFIGPEGIKAEKALESMAKIGPSGMPETLTRQQMVDIGRLSQAQQLATGQSTLGQQIMGLRKEAVAPLEQTAVGAEKTSLSQALQPIEQQIQEASGVRAILPTERSPETVLRGMTKPQEGYSFYKEKIPQIEQARERIAKQVGSPELTKPLTEDLKNYQVRRFLESPVNRGSDVSNALVNIGGTIGSIFGKPGQLAGQIFGRSQARDVAEKGGERALRTVNWANNYQKRLQNYIARNPEAAKYYGEGMFNAIERMSPRSFAIFNYLMSSKNQDYRKFIDQAGEEDASE